MTGDATEGAPDSSPAIPYADASVPTAQESALTSGITRGDIAALAVRLFGIYLLLQALPLAAYIVTDALQISRAWRRLDSGFALYAIYLMVFAGVGTWLVVKATRVAMWLLPKATGNPSIPAISGSAHDMQAVALSIVGLYLALSAFPDLAAIFARYANSDREMLPGLIKAGAQLIAGLTLFFRAKRVSAYWQRIGMARPPSADDDSGPL